MTNALDFNFSTRAVPLSRVSASVKTRRINILFIIDQLCTAGGAERALISLIGALPSERFNPELLTFRYDSSIDLFRNLPCPLHVLPLLRTYDWTALKAAFELRRLIQHSHIDIVHTFHESSDLWGGMVAKWAGVPVLISSRRDMGFLRGRKHKLAYRFIAKRFDKVLAVSERVRQQCIVAERLASNQVTTVYNGIRLADVDSVRSNRTCRSTLGIPPDRAVVTTVGNVRNIKGFDVLIQAAHLVCKQHPNVMFLLVGEPSDRGCAANLRELVTNLGLSDNLRFMGSRNDVLAILKASDVFCLPSRSEGFSNALIEAMACRLPCVATDVGGNGEAITSGINGFLVPSESPQALAAGVLEFLTAPENGRLMGCAARRTIEERFTFEAMISRVISLYDDLTQAAG